MGVACSLTGFHEATDTQKSPIVRCVKEKEREQTERDSVWRSGIRYRHSSSSRWIRLN